MSRPNPSQSIEAQARNWFTLLMDEDVSQETLVAWGAWMDSDPDHRAAYAKVSDIWTSAAAVRMPRRSRLPEFGGYDGASSVSAWRRTRTRQLVGAVAAVAVLMVGAGYLAETRSPAFEQRISTARAENSEAHLLDGSAVRVGAMTQLNIRYRSGERSIGMPTGEAAFSVAHDRSRPFVVQTPLAAITAVGTQFNVDVGNDRVSLDVTEGVVEVRLNGEGADAANAVLRIPAGERLRLEMSGGRLNLTKAKTALSPGWFEGRLEFRDEPLRSVLEDVNRYAAHPIVIADPALGELIYTGSVKLDATDGWASGLSTSFPLAVERDADDRIVLKKKSENPFPPLGSRSS